MNKDSLCRFLNGVKPIAKASLPVLVMVGCAGVGFAEDTDTTGIVALMTSKTGMISAVVLGVFGTIMGPFLIKVGANLMYKAIARFTK